jgi:PAS domain S-box-containing protein
LTVDVGFLVLLHAELHPRPSVGAASALVVVALYSYLRGLRLALVAAAAGVALVIASTGATDARFTLVVFPIACAALIVLVDTAAAERWRASAGMVRLHEKSDAILTGVAESVVVTSPSGRIAQWNRAAERTFACPTQEARGKACADVLGLRLDVRELDCSHGCALLCLGAETGDVEVWRTSATGQRQPLLATAVPVLDTDGKVVEVVHSYRDITRLKQADEAKTMFLATASHELKTPLTVIRGFSQMLLLPDVELDAEQKASALRAIDLRAAQLTGIVDRLLMSSRIEAGRIDLVPGSMLVATALAERIAELQSASGREVELDIADGIPALWVDVDAFTTIVDHLLDNAVKYSPNGGPISVSLLVSATDADRVELVIADAGVGMTEDQAQHCFDRFWQAEPTDVRRFGGTGIGLYIVRSLAEGMGGAVSVVSAPGAGAAFCVTLLLASAHRTPEPVVEVDEGDDEVGPTRPKAEPSIIREYMRQLGVPVEA